MNKMTKFGLTALASFVLAACGSSGGDSNQATTAPTKPAETRPAGTQNSDVNKNTSNSAVASATTNANTANQTGGALVLSGQDGQTNAKKVALTDPSLTKLNIEGKDITIGFGGGIYAGSWLSMNKQLYSCCGKYSDVRFGAYEGGSDGNAYFFYNGNPTTDMPTAGTATYVGDSIISANSPKFENLDDYVRGTANFNADFGAKTLTGTLNHNGFQPINVNANIAGNSFTGKANSADFDRTADVEGKFYGSQAKELGGIFNAEAEWGGAFGGKQ